MSKLIRETDKSSEDLAPALLPLSNATIVTHLKTCQKMAAEHAERSFKKFVQMLDATLGDASHRSRSNQEALELGEVQNLLRSHQAELERYYIGYLSEGFVKFKKKQLNTAVGGEVETDENLTLVGNEDLEESIAITTLTQRADAYFAEPLWALNQRFAVLNGGEHVTEATNPAAPIQLCESLRKAFKMLPLKSHVKTLVYKVYDRQLLGLCRATIEDINAYLKSQGVLPHLRYTVPTSAAPASYLADEGDVQEIPESHEEASGSDTGEAELDDQYQTRLLHAIRDLQNQLVMSGVSPLPGNAIPVSDTQLVHALANIQQQGTVSLAQYGQVVEPLDIGTVVDQLRQLLKEENRDAEVDKADIQTIDLVGMLFEYMLDDENIPDRVKALLSYLHTPFLKIAFIDPDFFEKSDHPARLLLNSLAEAGAQWVGNDGTEQYDMYEKIKYVVDRVLKEFDNDVKTITSLLLEFNSYTKNIIRRQELMEKRATEKAQGEEKLREVKLRVNDEIRKRTHNRELPSALLLFLLQPWSDYLSFALLRYGDHSEKWSKALALVDDVLWCIRPKTREEDKTRQREIHDDVLGGIKAGFDTIGFDQTKGTKLVDAITSLMQLALQSKKAEPAPAPMRHKLEQIAAEKAGTRPANDDVATPEEAQVIEQLKVIEFGTWFEFEGGRRLKVAWYNARTSHYMLVDQMGKRVDMMSGLTMARQMISGSAKIISGSSKPFFERALENILKKLNEKAENTQSGGADVVE